ncbi:hypothetical protein ACET8Y_15030 [Aeromonas veronii]
MPKRSGLGDFVGLAPAKTNRKSSLIVGKKSDCDYIEFAKTNQAQSELHRYVSKKKEAQCYSIGLFCFPDH